MSKISASMEEAKRMEMTAEEENQQTAREKTIVKTSIIGILANVLLAAFKAVIGLASGSVAITMDAVNNISDAASSLITIIGTKLASKPADKKHPYGYGRIEYLSALVISIIVLYAGITSFTESVKKIIHPEKPDYSTVALIIVAVAVIVKILLGRYVKSVGERVNSDSLVNSGEDATLDSIISASTLVAAILFLTVHISLEAWLGAIISVVIIKSGIDMIRETLSQILGERAEADLVKEIKKTVCSFPEVRGAYDLILNNYGPDIYTGPIHVEVPDTLDAAQIDQLTRRITDKVMAEHQIILTAVSVYSYNTKDPEVIAVRDNIMRHVMKHDHILQVHGFYVDLAEKVIRFDLVVSFDAPDRKALYQEIKREVQALYPDCKLTIALDADFSEH